MEKNSVCSEEEVLGYYDFIMEIAFGADNLLETEAPSTKHILEGFLYDMKVGEIKVENEESRTSLFILMASYLKHAKDIKVIKNNASAKMH